MRTGLRPILHALLLSAITVAAGCDKQASGKDLRTVKLGYFANLTHAQAVLAVHKGDFAQAIVPLSLETRVFNAGPSLIEALFAGGIDIAYVGPGPALNAHAKSRGQGIRIVAGAAANGVLIVAHKDSGINTLADLRDRRIASPQLANTQDISARHFVLNELKQSNADNVVPIANAEQVGLMLRKQIDAAWVPEPWGSRLVAEANAKVIGYEHDLWPEKEFTLTVVVTTPRFLAEHPEIVERFLQVHTTWTDRLQREPDKHLPDLSAAMLQLTGKKLPEGVLPAALRNVKFTNDPLAPTLSAMAQWAYDLRFVKDQPSTDGLVDLTILNKLRNQPSR